MIEYDNRYFDYSNGNLNVKNNGMGDMIGIGTAISGIAGAIGTGFASRLNLKAQRETNAANLALARMLNDWNIQQWEREMAYNSPANKLKLLEEAGLNPVWFGANLGPTETLAPLSANLANQLAPQLDVGAIGSSLSNLSSSLIASGEYYIKKKELEQRDRELDIMESRTNQLNLESSKLIEKYDQEIDNLRSEKGLTDEKINEVKENIKVLVKLADNLLASADLARLKIRESKNAEYKLYWEGELVRLLIPYQVKNLAALTGLSNAQAATEAAKYANFLMDTSKKEVEIQLTKDLSVLITRLADGLLYYNDIARIDANWRGKINCMTVITGYANAASGIINSVGNVVNSFWGPLGKMRSAIGQSGGFKLNMDNPFNTYRYNPMLYNWNSMGNP